MVVVVNGLLSNGRLPHAYYYKRPRPVEWSNHLYGGGLREPRSRPLSPHLAGRAALNGAWHDAKWAVLWHGALQALTELARRTR